MNNIRQLLNLRFQLGYNKYKSGVKIGNDMSKYTVSGEDSYIDMQIEELLDAMIYTAAAKLRYMSREGKYTQHSTDDNARILREIVNSTVDGGDKHIVKFNAIITNLITLFKQTMELKSDLKLED